MNNIIQKTHFLDSLRSFLYGLLEAGWQTFAFIVAIRYFQADTNFKSLIAGPTKTCACNECRFMKMNTIEKLRDCLTNLSPEIDIPKSIREKAYDPLKRMLEWSKS